MIRPIAWFAVLLGSLITSAGPLRAQSAPPTDSAQVSYAVLPAVFYLPETGFGGGGVLGRYAPGVDGSSAVSSTVMAALVTTKRQVILQASADWFLPEGRRFFGKVKAERFPNTFFGVGPLAPIELAEDYGKATLIVEGSYLWPLTQHFRLGPSASAQVERIYEWDPVGALSTAMGPIGNQYGMGSVGVEASWDRRDAVYDTKRGVYAMLRAQYLLGRASAGRGDGAAHIEIDLRGYFPVYGLPIGGQSVALNVFYEGVPGVTNPLLFPQLGGDERMRGFTEGRFRDRHYVGTQLELRSPLFWRLKGTLFGSYGNVGPTLPALRRGPLRWSAGFGGWLRVNPEGVHLRLDFAWGEDGEFGIYATVGEAF